MGSIPVAGAKSHLNRFFGLGGFSYPHGEPSSKPCFELGSHFCRSRSLLVRKRLGRNSSHSEPSRYLLTFIFAYAKIIYNKHLNVGVLL